MARFVMRSLMSM